MRRIEIILLLLLSSRVMAHVEGIGFEQRLNSPVSPALAFLNSHGNAVQLGDHFGRGPVVLVLGYYRCKNLCQLTLSQLLKSVGDVSQTLDNRFSTLFISIDPKETSEVALQKEKSLAFQQPSLKRVFFWTGREIEIQALAGSIGFRYQYDPKTDQYAHPSGAVILTPEGRVSRYLFGVDFPTRDLRLALVEASSNKIGSYLDKFLLLCFHYDPSRGAYGPQVMFLLRAFGLLTVLSLALCIYRLSRTRKSS